MTDPMNTDALRARAEALDNGLSQTPSMLRAAADEVDRLRDRLQHVERWTVPEAIRTWKRERADKDRLRAVIENAPHDPSCWLVDPQSTWTKNERDCTCWKADVL